MASSQILYPMLGIENPGQIGMETLLGSSGKVGTCGNLHGRETTLP